jgi:hypothetical protein
MLHRSRSISVQVDAYEAKKQELIAENSDLRNMLRSMQACFPLNPSLISICPVPMYKLLVFRHHFFEYV